MLSLDNALDEVELRDFDRRVRDLLGDEPYSYVAELKMDGLVDGARIIATARSRKPSRAATERWAKTSPKTRAPSGRFRCARKWTFEVRGEVVLNRKAFERLNARAELAELPLFANPRTRRRDRCACWTRRSRPRGSSIIYAYFLVPHPSLRNGNRWSSCRRWASR